MNAAPNSAAYLAKLSATLGALDRAAVDRGVQLIESAWLAGRKIITLGNGGSALTASHFVTDWNKSTFLKTGRPFRGVCLADNIGLLTACANDLSYERVFVEQVRWLLEPGDLVVAVSGSGNSPNVLAAVEYANAHQGVTLGLCGFDGGRLRTLAHHAVHVAIPDMQIVEDVHLSFGHLVMQHLCRDDRAKA